MVVELKEVQSGVFLNLGLYLFVVIVENSEDVSDILVGGVVGRIFLACLEVPN